MKCQAKVREHICLKDEGHDGPHQHADGSEWYPVFTPQQEKQ